MRSRIHLMACHFCSSVLLLSLLQLPSSNTLMAQDIPYYVKKGTWYESLLASREAMAQHKQEMT